MKKTQIAGCLLTALLLCGFDQATAQQTSKKNSSKNKNNVPQIGMAPKCCDQGSWDMNFDFLWWTTGFNGNNGVHVGLEAPRAKVNFKRPSSSWDPGVRLNLGWNTGYDNWDIQGMWTYFFGSSGGHRPNKFKFRYNAADLELGKAFYVSPHFFIRPFTGAHAIWTSVRTSSLLPVASVLNPALPGGTFVEPYDYLTRIDAGAWGIGPRIGVNTTWGNFDGFSLIANISSSIVYGQHLDKAHTTVLETTGADLFVSFRDKEYWELMPTMQIQFGPTYAFCFGDGNQFHISALWETNIIWNAANHLDVDKSISMSGLTIDFGFAF